MNKHTVALMLLVGGAASAQQPTAIVRGTVVGEGTGGLAYAIVSVEPGGRERFTDSTGAFDFGRVVTGSARLRARRIGFHPLDTLITVTPDMPPLSVRMEPLRIVLATIRVTGRRCRSGGAPDPATSPEVAAIFEQLRENARRYRLVATRYPFVYRTVRTFEEPGLYAATRQKSDTLTMSSASEWSYAPGSVVTNVVIGGRSERQMNIPALAQLADSAFVANHCFDYAGVSKAFGRPLVRVDFRPTMDLDVPDIEGSVYLDAEHDYIVRRLVVSLTQAARVAQDLDALDVTTVYRDTRPPIVVLDTVVAVRRGKATNGRQVRRVERQTFVDFSFRRGVTPP